MFEKYSDLKLILTSLYLNNYSYEKLNNYFYLLQPVAEEPFRFATELDDLPRETLKQMIFAETVNFKQNV